MGENDLNTREYDRVSWLWINTGKRHSNGNGKCLPEILILYKDDFINVTYFYKDLGASYHFIILNKVFSVKYTIHDVISSY